MKKMVFERRGQVEGGDLRETVNTPPHSRLYVDVLGKSRFVPIASCETVFRLLPNATSLAAAKDDVIVSIGTGTEVIARAAKGGVNVKTQATTPADNDNAILIPGTGTALTVPITAVSQPRFRTRVNLSQITELVFGAGFDENITSPIPNATAGEGASFYFDPTGEVTAETMGLPAAALANFILTEKVNGTDTFKDSGVQVIAGIDYELEIQIGEDLKPVYFINGAQVGVGASALTSGDSVSPVIGVQIAGTPSGQKDFDCRYVAVERFIG